MPCSPYYFFFGVLRWLSVVGRHFIAVATAAVKWPGNDLMRKVRSGQNLKFIPARQVRVARNNTAQWKAEKCRNKSRIWEIETIRNPKCVISGHGN